MTSEEYWRERELENIASDYESDGTLTTRIQGIYYNQLNEIQKEIDSFYQRYGSSAGLSLAEAKKAVAQFDVKSFQATAKAMVEARDFSDEANKQLKLYNATMKINRLELLKSKIGYQLTEMTENVIDATGNYAKDLIAETYQRQAGILGDSVEIDTLKKADQIVKGSFHNAKYSTNVWGQGVYRFYHWENVLHSEIGNLLEQYLINGKGSIALAEKLTDRFRVARYRAEALARTEVRNMQTMCQKDFMEQNDIEKYRFLAEPTACKKCLAVANGGENNDGVYPVSEIQVGLNASPIHTCCRCSVTPHIDRVELEREQDDFYIGRSVGAMAKNYDIYDPASGKNYKFAEGTYIQNQKIFAGYGSNKPLHDGVAEGLTEQYGGETKYWQHVKGHGIINIGSYEETRYAEVHWFQEKSVGKVKFKIKEWLD